MPVALEDLAPFGKLSRDDFVQHLQNLRDKWLDEFGNSPTFDIAIPFVEASLSNVLDFGLAFESAVLSKLNFDTIDTLQDFIYQANHAGILANNVNYDSNSKQVHIPFNFQIELDKMSLRDLDALGLVNLDLMEQEGIFQVGDFVDPDALMDAGLATLADLASADMLTLDSLIDWNDVDKDPIETSGLLTTNGLMLHSLVAADMVDMDELLDSKLTTLVELVETEFVTLATIVSNLGFIREIDLLANTISDLAFDLASSAVDLVSIDDVINDTTATLTSLFNDGLLELGDLAIQSLDISDLLGNSLASLTELVTNNLVTVTDFVDTTVVNLENLVTNTGVTLLQLIDSNLVAAEDFAQTLLLDVSNVITSGAASLRSFVEQGLLQWDDFTDIDIGETALIAADLLNQFEIDYNELGDEFNNVSLHTLVNSGLVSLEELIDESLLATANLLGGTEATLGQLVESGVAPLRDLVGQWSGRFDPCAHSRT